MQISAVCGAVWRSVEQCGAVWSPLEWDNTLSRPAFRNISSVCLPVWVPTTSMHLLHFRARKLEKMLEISKSTRLMPCTRFFLERPKAIVQKRSEP